MTVEMIVNHKGPFDGLIVNVEDYSCPAVRYGNKELCKYANECLHSGSFIFTYRGKTVKDENGVVAENGYLICGPKGHFISL